jgi:hypothetical protein
LALIIVLAAAPLGGCFSGNKDRGTARPSGPPMAGVVGDDVVYVDVAIIERTLGDAFLNRETSRASPPSAWNANERW